MSGGLRGVTNSPDIIGSIQELNPSNVLTVIEVSADPIILRFISNVISDLIAMIVFLIA